MHQLTQESKSLWRIKHNYRGEATSDEEIAFWNKLQDDKEAHIKELKDLIKKGM